MLFRSVFWPDYDILTSKAPWAILSYPRGTIYLVKSDQGRNVAAKPVAVSDSSQWLASQALADRDIMIASRWSIAEHLDEGTL